MNCYRRLGTLYSLFQMSSKKKSKDFAVRIRRSTTKKCDCILIVGNEKISAHQRTLADASPVFEKMFFGVMASTKIEIPDIDYEVFKQLLEFLYFQELQIQSLENAWALVYAGSKYIIDSLLSQCVSFIQDNMTLGYLLLSYEYSEHYNQEELNKFCWREIICYTKGIFMCDYHIKPETWCKLLDEKYLNIFEKELIKQASLWAVEECKFRSIKPSKENIWKVLYDCDIVNRLHFYSVSPVEYDYFTELFYKNEIKAITNIHTCKTRKGAKTRLLNELLQDDLKKVITFPKFERQCRLVSGCYELREWIKIYKNFRLSKDDMLTTQVTADRTVAIFGIVVSTEHSPPDALLNFYTGGFTVEIFKHKGSKVVALDKIVEPYTLLKYDCVTYINFPRVIIFDAGVDYIIGIRYSTGCDLIRSQVLCHYLGDINKRDVTFRFANEFSGSALRGIAFFLV